MQIFCLGIENVAKKILGIKLSAFPLFVLYFFFFLVFATCSKAVRVPAPPPWAENEQLTFFSENPTIDIYLDASASMRGFTTPGYQTYFAQFIQNIESSVFSTWPKGKTNLKKFGTQVYPISHADFLNAASPNFYNEPETRIDRVIEGANARCLSLIITDLFQNEADTLTLSRFIFEKFVRTGLAVGILGIRSQFDGIVFDVGVNGLQFSYRSTNEPNKFRPFYILMLGKHADIIHYYERLTSDYLNNYVTQFSLFSRYIVRTLPSFDNSKVVNTYRMNEVLSLLASGKRDYRVKQFRLRRNADIGAFKVTLSYNREPFTIYSNLNLLEYQVKLINQTNLDGAVIHEAENAFTINSLQVDTKEINFNISFNATNLPSNAIYCFEVSLYPQPEAYRIPDWVSRWNMNTTKLQNWINAPLTFEGDSTLNLKRFVDEIAQTTIRFHKPMLAKVYFYIKKG